MEQVMRVCTLPRKTYKTEASAVKAAEGLLANISLQDPLWYVVAAKDDRFYPVFFVRTAEQRSMMMSIAHRGFNVVGW